MNQTSITRCRFVLAAFMILFFLLVDTRVQAQLPSTQLFAIFPTGGQAGQVVDLQLTRGHDLEEIHRVIFNHPGISALPKLENVADTLKDVSNPFTVTISADVPPGPYEVRAVGLYGVSNPRTFVVGTQPESNEVEPNNTRDLAMAMDFNQTINGRMNLPTDIDWFKFEGRSGQRILVEGTAYSVDSRMATTLELYDESGRLLVLARNTQVNKDALLDVTLPDNGRYFLKVYDFVYAGGDDYPYRLRVKTSPHIDFIVPPAGTPGSNQEYTVYGRNLPGGQLSPMSIHGRALEQLVVSISLPNQADVLDARTILEPFSAGMDAVPFTINSAHGPSNAVMVYLSDTAPVLEMEPNNDGRQAQKLFIPSDVAGQFQARGDIDSYSFEAQPKDVFWLEVIAHRAGSAADPVFVLDQVKVNEKGEESLTRITALDDDPANPLVNLFETLTDDVAVKFVAPTHGTYRISLRDRYGKTRGDPSLQYRLILRKESPDFRVVAVPCTLTAPNARQPAPSEIALRRGDHFAVHVMAFRRDGFAAPITVAAEGLPPGVSCRDISIGTTPSSGVLVFSSTEDAPAWTGTVKITAKAQIDELETVQTLKAAQATAKAAGEALTAAENGLSKQTDDLTKAAEALEVAQAAFAAKPEDDGLKKKAADAATRSLQIMNAHMAANDAKAAAENKRNQASEIVGKLDAVRQSRTRFVTHPARYGTIQWTAAKPNPDVPQKNILVSARIAQSVELSVVVEPAPFQVSTDVHRMEVNHGRQILVPMHVVRRNGFDQPIDVKVSGLPESVQAEKKTISTETSDALIRLFVPPEVPVGTYAAHLSLLAPVTYRKNPARADRLKVEFTAVEQIARSAEESLKRAMATKEASDKKASDDADALKLVAEAKVQSDRSLAAAKTAEKAAAEVINNPSLNSEARVAAEKKLQIAHTFLKEAEDAHAEATKNVDDATVVAQQSAQAGINTADAFKLAEDKNTLAQADKKIAEERFKAATDYSKEAKIQFSPTSTSIIITVKAAPYTVAASPKNDGNIKQGSKLEVHCEVKRQNGFAGPVTLTLPIPAGVKGIKAEPITISAGKSTGTLVVEAESNAPEVQLANMVIRAVTTWDGEAAVDQPLTLKVVN